LVSSQQSPAAQATPDADDLIQPGRHAPRVSHSEAFPSRRRASIMVPPIRCFVVVQSMDGVAEGCQFVAANLSQYPY
jgi:hypothetical protein